MFSGSDATLRLPRDAVVPDYADGGLFGLMGAIRTFLDGGRWTALGGNDHGADIDAEQPVLVFILIDGLGDSFLQRFGQGGVLLAHRRRRLTSVFPSTTASAVTTVLTGVSPAVHGLTGWYIRDRRFGGVLAPLPMKRRAGGALGPFAPQRLFPYDTLFQKRRRASVVVSPQHIAWSPFSRRHARGARIHAYNGLQGMVDAVVEETVALGRTAGGYVYAYYPMFDTLSHDFGADSDEAVTEFWRIDKAIGKLLERLAGSGADVLISADHGFIDSPEPNVVSLDDYPHVLSMLDGPLFGERRAALCELRHGADAEFAAFVGESLADKAVLVRSDDLLAHGFLGPGPHHPRLRERIGSHVLLMEPGWTLRDRLPGEPIHRMIGVHGGLTSDEMWIPLIQVHC